MAKRSTSTKNAQNSEPFGAHVDNPLAMVGIGELTSGLGYSSWTIHHWIKQGWFPAPFRGPNGKGPRRWFVADVVKAMRERQVREIAPDVQERGRKLHEASPTGKRKRPARRVRPRTVADMVP